MRPASRPTGCPVIRLPDEPSLHDVKTDRPHPKHPCFGPAKLVFFQTSCLLARGWPMPPRVPTINRSAPFQGFGGARRDRTDDLMLAKHALSQLSYSPVSRISRRLVGLERFELSTSRLSSARSNQLSYRPQPDVFTARCRLAPHRVFPHTGEPASFHDKSQQSRTRELVREERETKTAASRAW